jgi:hypothetical protein
MHTDDSWCVQENGFVLGLRNWRPSGRWKRVMSFHPSLRSSSDVHAHTLINQRAKRLNCSVDLIAATRSRRGHTVAAPELYVLVYTSNSALKGAFRQQRIAIDPLRVSRWRFCDDQTGPSPPHDEGRCKLVVTGLIRARVVSFRGAIYCVDCRQTDHYGLAQFGLRGTVHRTVI